MKSSRYPNCSHCGSDNVLPFEDDSPIQSDTTLFIVMLTAVLVITGYFLFVISSYLYTPIVVFIAIIVTTRMINRHQAERKKTIEVLKNQDFVCLDCSQFFRWGDSQSAQSPNLNNREDS